MQTQMRSEIFKKKLVVIKNPIQFNKEDLVEKKIDFNHKGITGVITDIMLNGIHLVSRDLTMRDESYSIEIEHSFSFVKLHFEIEGDNEYIPENPLGRGIYIPEGHYNLFYIPNIKGVLNYRTKRRKTLEITFTEAYLEQLFYPNLKTTIPLLADAITNNTAYTMWNTSKSISPKLHILIEDIIQCNYTGAIKKAFLESKVVEVLSHLFTIINEEENTKINEDLSESDYLKIVAVEQILKTQFKEKHTLASIASQVGLNNFKIKKQFKIVFNTTVFQYLTELRMEYAKQLILEKDISICRVSEELGYKNPQHFTVAFKKTFGYLPSKLKKIV
ncbi:helix-turn-helix domain-containing protein [Flavobacterium chungangense]|uniref:AraC family transcriptional regulator n=1 Tax=Flavobacterium chungangense TaxID=554283 RepID=A0A6V6YWL3_9FLAO|nr:helix-turn-helix transcriptional regulator [Flavobacterium chungangense]CAD0003679.1 AraC family transcriptional regulator [Flavobacterium chungangense]